MFLRAGFFAILACISLAAFADSPSDTVTIPLKDIWALQMPGTTKIEKLEPTAPVNSLRDRIAKQLTHSIPGEIPPKLRSGFAIDGTGYTALEEACAVFEDTLKPKDCFSSDSFVSLVFSSNEFSWYVHLTDVVRQGNKIQIHYKFVPHATNEISQNFAIIPVGKLSDGKYEVEIIQDPIDKKWLDSGVKPVPDATVDWTICKPFSFEIGCNAH